MRRILALLAFILIPASMLLAQDAADKMNKSATPPPIVKPSRDFIMINLGYNTWLNKPDSVKTKTIGYTFNAFVCYDFPFKKTHFSFAAGLGVSNSVVYLDHQVIANRNADTLGVQARFIADTMGYKRYKFATTYLQAPFELRYFSNAANRNKGFKAAIGLQVGTLLGAHTKGLRSISGTNVREKVNTKRYVSPWNFAATARVGWGNFAIYGSYNITNVFKDNAGPEATPLSVGICLTGL